MADRIATSRYVKRILFANKFLLFFRHFEVVSIDYVHFCKCNLTIVEIEKQLEVILGRKCRFTFCRVISMG